MREGNYKHTVKEAQTSAQTLHPEAKTTQLCLLRLWKGEVEDTSAVGARLVDSGAV